MNKKEKIINDLYKLKNKSIEIKNNNKNNQPTKDELNEWNKIIDEMKELGDYIDKIKNK